MCFYAKRVCRCVLVTQSPEEVSTTKILIDYVWVFANICRGNCVIIWWLSGFCSRFWEGFLKSFNEEDLLTFSRLVIECFENQKWFPVRRFSICWKFLLGFLFKIKIYLWEKFLLMNADKPWAVRHFPNYS